MLPTTNQLQADAEAALRDILADVIGPHVRWGSEGAPLVIERTAERIVREFGARVAILTALEANAGTGLHVQDTFAQMEQLYAEVFPAADISDHDGHTVNIPNAEEMNVQLELPDELMPQPMHYTLEVQDGSLGSTSEF